MWPASNRREAIGNTSVPKECSYWILIKRNGSKVLIILKTIFALSLHKSVATSEIHDFY